MLGRIPDEGERPEVVSGALVFSVNEASDNRIVSLTVRVCGEKGEEKEKAEKTAG
jgi:Mg2+/Co2+ transporter CorC